MTARPLSPPLASPMIAPPCARHEEKISSLERRVERLEEGMGRLLAEVSEVSRTLGAAPDPLRGVAGTGAVGIIYKIGNKLLEKEPGALSLSFDEGETTSVQSRPELVGRAKMAEAELVKAHSRVRLALIGLGVTTVTTVGTVVIAWLAN